MVDAFRWMLYLAYIRTYFPGKVGGYASRLGLH